MQETPERLSNAAEDSFVIKLKTRLGICSLCTKMPNCIFRKIAALSVRRCIEFDRTANEKSHLSRLRKQSNI
ncbi:MAG: hypothetical protein ALAOOOJD_00172 [bacterium]|nr:hypothetical protein [bacterium]